MTPTFPLYRAPLEPLDVGSCAVCGQQTEVFDVHWLAGADEDGSFPCCYACIRAGQGGWTWDTEIGQVGRAEAAAGRIRGWAQGFEVEFLPGQPTGEELLLQGADVITYLHNGEKIGRAWEFVDVTYPDLSGCSTPEEQRELLQTEGIRVVRKTPGQSFCKVEPDLLEELLRTPPYPSCQGAVWLFCCRQPMVFVGNWTQADFTRHAPPGKRGGARKWFNKIVDDVEPELWDSSDVDFYAFQCPQCEKHRARWGST
jgi:hypothetical protein